MPLVIDERKGRGRAIGVLASMAVSGAILCLWLFAPWSLPSRPEEEWTVPDEFDFPEIAGRVFRDVKPRELRIRRESSEPADRPLSVERSAIRAEALDRVRAEPRRSLGSSGARSLAKPWTEVRRAATSTAATIAAPSRGSEGPSSRVYSRVAGPVRSPSSEPESVDRRSGDFAARAGAEVPLSSALSDLLAWMREHPGRIEPQVETFLMHGAGPADLGSMVRFLDADREYRVYLAALVDDRDEGRSELRIGVLDLDDRRIARLVDKGLRGEAQSLKVGNVIVDVSGRVSWVDANPRSTSERKWYAIFERWLASRGVKP